MYVNPVVFYNLSSVSGTVTVPHQPGLKILITETFIHSFIINLKKVNSF